MYDVLLLDQVSPSQVLRCHTVSERDQVLSYLWRVTEEQRFKNRIILLLQDFTTLQQVEVDVCKQHLFTHLSTNSGQSPPQCLQRRAHLDLVLDVALEERLDFVEVQWN